ncbi:MAG TPA: IclR family transcriptional regulator [Lichenihabitans sp.]|nr:IclR family transcriptional regulator [Lichenihabitans sp.]
MKPDIPAVSERGEPGPNASARGASRERGLDRVVELFAHLHRVGHPVGIGDLARALSAPRSTLYGLVRILTDAGLLESVGPRGEVFFGKSLYFYGMDFLREHDVLGRARAEVDRLARETGETAQLCVLHERKYSVAYMSAGRRPFRISSEIGVQIPLPWTASGRLLLSDLSADEIRAFVPPEDLHPPRGAPMTIGAFIEAVAEARRQGFCITSGLVDPFTHCIAGPIHDRLGRVTATLCFVVAFDTPPERIKALRDTLLTSGHVLSLAPDREPPRSL